MPAAARMERTPGWHSRLVHAVHLSQQQLQGLNAEQTASQHVLVSEELTSTSLAAPTVDSLARMRCHSTSCPQQDMHLQKSQQGAASNGLPYQAARQNLCTVPDIRMLQHQSAGMEERSAKIPRIASQHHQQLQVHEDLPGSAAAGSDQVKGSNAAIYQTPHALDMRGQLSPAELQQRQHARLQKQQQDQHGPAGPAAAMDAGQSGWPSSRDEGGVRQSLYAAPAAGATRIAMQQPQAGQSLQLQQDRTHLLQGLQTLQEHSIQPAQQLAQHVQQLQQHSANSSAAWSSCAHQQQQQQGQHGVQHPAGGALSQQEDRVDYLDALLLIWSLQQEASLLQPEQLSLLDGLIAALMEHTDTQQLHPEQRYRLARLVSSFNASGARQQEQRLAAASDDGLGGLIKLHLQQLLQQAMQGLLPPVEPLLRRPLQPLHSLPTHAVQQQVVPEGYQLEQQLKHPEQQQQHQHQQMQQLEAPCKAEPQVHSQVDEDKAAGQAQPCAIRGDLPSKGPAQDSCEAPAVRYKGVHNKASGLPYKAQISLLKVVYLASFHTAEDAARMYNAAACFRDPTTPREDLNQVQPMFPPDHVEGELQGVTGTASEAFGAWAEKHAPNRQLQSSQTGIDRYTLRWSE